MQKVGLWKDYGLVFPSAVGTSLFHRNVVRAFKELLQLLAVKLVHSFAGT